MPTAVPADTDKPTGLCILGGVNRMAKFGPRGGHRRQPEARSQPADRNTV